MAEYISHLHEVMNIISTLFKDGLSAAFWLTWYFNGGFAALILTSGIVLTVNAKAKT